MNVNARVTALESRGMLTMKWRHYLVAMAVMMSMGGCGEDDPDSGEPSVDAALPDVMIPDAAPADAMVDLTVSCAAAIECAIDTPRQRDECALEYGETVDDRYQALLACAQRAEGGACDTQTSVHVACLADHCTPEAEACLGPLPAGNGSTTCAEVYACVVACEGNVGCTFDCYSRGSTMALRIFDRLQDCNALAVCDLSDVDCIGRPCGGLVRACGIPR